LKKSPSNSSKKDRFWMVRGGCKQTNNDIMLIPKTILIVITVKN